MGDTSEVGRPTSPMQRWGGGGRDLSLSTGWIVGPEAVHPGTRCSSDHRSIAAPLYCGPSAGDAATGGPSEGLGRMP